MSLPHCWESTIASGDHMVWYRGAWRLSVKCCFCNARRMLVGKRPSGHGPFGRQHSLSTNVEDGGEPCPKRHESLVMEALYQPPALRAVPMTDETVLLVDGEPPPLPTTTRRRAGTG